MKKIIAILISLVMLIPAFAAFPAYAEGEDGADEKLSAKFYNVTSDECWLYVVFSKPVADPKPEDEVFLGLVGHGWPVNDPPVLRYLVRCEFNDVEVVTDTVWRFSKKSAKTDAAKKEYREWWLYHNIPSETEPASVDNWSIRLFGQITTADGSEELADSGDIVYDGVALFEMGPNYKIQDVTEDPSSYTTVASLSDLGITQTTTSEEPVTTSVPDTTETPDTDGESDSISTSADSKPSDSTEKVSSDGDGSIGIWIAVGAAVLIIAAVAVVVIIKKKKSK